MSDVPQISRVFDLSAHQDGCVSTGQLLAADFSKGEIESLVDRGVLIRVVRGVYLTGSRVLTTRQLQRAALLAAGEGSALSHWTAAALHGLLEPDYSEVWVTTPARRGERTLTTNLPVAETGEPATISIVGSRRSIATALQDGRWIAAPASALVGAAGLGDHDPDRVVRAWREAYYRKLLNTEELRREVGRGITGSAFIGEIWRAHPIVIDRETEVDTKAEFALLEAVLELGLPRPLTNRPLRLPGAIYLPDQHYADVGLVVEADGGVHRERRRRAADRARDRHMRRHGLVVLRFWNEEIDADANACAGQVAEQYERLFTDINRR